MRDYYVHSENFTENELIIDHVHESREINQLLHESREYFRSPITGNNFVLSRFTAIKNRHSRFTKNPLSDPLDILLRKGKKAYRSPYWICRELPKADRIGYSFLVLLGSPSRRYDLGTTLAHSRNHVTDLSTAGGNLFKMAAKIKSERIWVRGLENGKNKQTGGKGKLVWVGCAFKQRLKVRRTACKRKRKMVKLSRNLFLLFFDFQLL